ncbi:MAG: hypothetical protein ACI4I7_03780 [Oscillospiraceae bacterium]
MTKFQKSLVAAFLVSLIMAFALPEISMDNFIFSGFSLGWSSELTDKDSDDRVEIIDDDTDIEYSFKIADFFSFLFD